jgi:hypothetical protein
LTITPAFIPNKWVDLQMRGGADAIQVNTRISNSFIGTEEIQREITMSKGKEQ